MSEHQIKHIAELAYQEVLSMRDTPVITTAQLKKELAQILKKQERLTDLYLEGEMDKEMLDERNGAFQRRKYQIEEELEKRKNIAEADDITKEDIEQFITQFVEDVKNAYSPAEDEFMRIMFNTFVEKVVVGKEKITVHIHTPFSRMGGGDNERFRGVIHHLEPVKLQATITRKKHVHGKNI